MKKIIEYSKFDNFRLYLRLKKAGDLGNKVSAKLARSMSSKYKSKSFLLEYNEYQMQELSKKALSGNIRAIMKIRKMQEDEEKEIAVYRINKMFSHGR
jgi:hypothetical protein